MFREQRGLGLACVEYAKMKQVTAIANKQPCTFKVLLTILSHIFSTFLIKKATKVTRLGKGWSADLKSVL